MSSRSRSCSPVREKGPRVSYEQVNALVDYMEINREVAIGCSNTTAGRHKAMLKWKAISSSLNTMSGSRKDSKGWSAYWSNYKNKLKSRVRARAALSEVDRRVLDILGPSFKGKPKARLCVNPIKYNEVYLVKAEDSPQAYDEWICGGSIVSPLYIVTSAACVEDLKYMYAIAGYQKYVRAENLNIDQCTKQKKKKIVYVCIPKAYEFDYPDVTKWARVDIAVAKVESPYDFNDESYKTLCSYIPSPIQINYVRKYQKWDTDALVLGWGHTEKWRDPTDTADYNNAVLLGTSVQIVDKSVCKVAYGGGRNPNMTTLIDKYMICVSGEGNIGTGGRLIKKPDVNELKDGCGPDGILRGTGVCEDEKSVLKQGFYSEISLRGINTTDNIYTKSHGICQNDHGGPLITWVGAEEVLIGVASVFRIKSETKECTGPYLFTSTWCNSAFLDCVVEGKVAVDETRRAVCDQLPEEGIHLKERKLSWMGHPDGPADNEVFKVRPQMPLHG